jgi:hypothetical protein
MTTPNRHHKRTETDAGCRAARRRVQERRRQALITEAELRRIWPSR